MSKHRAMIIEDNEDLAIIFSEALQAAGFETTMINDGERAMQMLREVHPVVIVLDLHLPHMSGDQILARIRADEELADTRVVIATADPQMADELQDRSDLVLLKPVSFNQLRDLAARLAPR
jgi:CheY-like chemotaxis protein